MTRLKFGLVILCSLGILTLSACGSSGKSGASASKNTVVRTHKTINYPSDEECQQYAERIIAVCSAGDKRQAQLLIDYENIVDFAIDGVKGPSNFKKGFRKGVLNGLEKEGGPLFGFRQVAESGGFVKFLRVKEKDGVKSAIVRTFSPGMGVNFIELVVEKNEKGQISLVDYFSYMSGEYYSETVKRLFQMGLAAEVDQTYWGKLTSTETEKLKNLQTMQLAINAFRVKKYNKFLEFYDRLSEEGKREKIMLLLKLQSTQNMSDEAYQETMKDYMRFHPNDPSLNLISLDHYALAGEFKKLSESAKSLNQMVGGDSYVAVVLAGAYRQLGNNDEAKQALENGWAKEPSLELLYDSGINQSVTQGDFQDAVKWVTRYDKQFPGAVDSYIAKLRRTRTNRVFFRSKEFAGWKKIPRKKKIKPSYPKGTTEWFRQKQKEKDQK